MINQIHIGDCREIMARMAASSVDCIVTSPPYFGLRDYGHEGQIGLEPTPEDFISAMVEVFREARRVLRDDGTLWLNLGDSYASSGSSGPQTGQLFAGRKRQSEHITKSCGYSGSASKPKNLIGIPWRVAFALQADGWYLRQDIIWHKPNPMPESVRDRCTKAHEYIFLLTKSPRYFYDHKAVMEPMAASSIPRLKQNVAAQVGTTRANGGAKTNGNLKAAGDLSTGLRNRRSVWTVTTKPFRGAHFATYPIDLVEPCILAGCRPGGVVLDPFIGSGTTAIAAEKHNRLWIGCELNPDYAALAEARIASFRQIQMELL